MKECRDSVAYRKNILENLIDRPPFRYEKKTSSDKSSIDIDESENVVNISFTKNRQDPRYNNPQVTNERCHTTINLFINDPHLIQRNFTNELPQNRNSDKNEIFLGKNIPNHSLMENLLGDLGVKKFSSAPNMIPTYNNGSGRCSTKTSMKRSPGRTLNAEKRETRKEEMSFLFVNDMRCRGDFNRKQPEPMEKYNQQVIPEDEIEGSMQHHNDNYVFRVSNDESISNLENRNHPITSQEKFIKDPSCQEKTNIFHKQPIGDVQLTELEKPVQLRRTVPNFCVRTKMVKNILNMDPEYMNTYYSRLIRNHRKMFETLRQTNFQENAGEKETTTSKSNGINAIVLNDTLKRDHNDINIKQITTAVLKPEIGKIGEIDKKGSTHIVNNTSDRTVCSIESHGSYDEYKKNLIKRPDGTLCCENTNVPDDEMWSRAETRNIITSEFIKDKIRRFERFTRKKRGNQENLCECNDTKANKMKEEIISTVNNYDECSKYTQNPNEETDPLTILNQNLKAVSFPKETKNAMMRLLAANLNNNSKYDRLKSRARKWSDQPEKQNNESYLLKSRNELLKAQEKNKRFWPGMAERVRARPEENTP